MNDARYDTLKYYKNDLATTKLELKIIETSDCVCQEEVIKLIVDKQKTIDYDCTKIAELNSKLVTVNTELSYYQDKIKSYLHDNLENIMNLLCEHDCDFKQMYNTYINFYENFKDISGNEPGGLLD